MKEISLPSELLAFKSFAGFSKSAELCESDLILTNEFIYKPFIEPLEPVCRVLFQEQFGAGEPSDEMVDAILTEAQRQQYSRVIAVGGGTIIDIAKFLVLEDIKNSDEAYDKKDTLKKDKRLITIPTTCGTGSEVTCISVVNRTRIGTKMGLVTPAFYADQAVLIPELLKTLPWHVFATSSIDALVHAVESFLNPQSTPTCHVFSKEAIRLILKGYQTIADRGQEMRHHLAENFLRASTYAGIAFGNYNNGAVHAMSYAFGGKYHVAHGESNYQFFTEVLRAYQSKISAGRFIELLELLTELLHTQGDAIVALDELLETIFHKKSMSEYGAAKDDVDTFADSTANNQQRLLANCAVPLSRDEIAAIYSARL